MDERDQPLEGFLLALSPFEKQPGDLRRMVDDAAILARFAAFKVSPPFPALQAGTPTHLEEADRAWDPVRSGATLAAASAVHVG